MIKNHLSDEDLASRVRESSCLEQQRRWQAVFLRQTQPAMPVGAVAQACGVKYRTVTQWTWGYNKHGASWLDAKARGGRRRGLMSAEDESEFMAGLARDTREASHVNVAKVKAAAERRLGRPLPKDYAYDLLWRHGWRKVMPRTRHPKGDAEVREDFKKNSRRSWMPPPRR